MGEKLLPKEIYEMENIEFPQELDFMYSICIANKCTKAINLGTYYGVSAIVLGMGVSKVSNTGELFTVGTMRYHNAGRPTSIPFKERRDVNWTALPSEEIKESIDKWIKPTKLHFIKSYTDDADTIGMEDTDIIFIDADHSIHGCLSDLLKYSQLVSENGVILMHDYQMASVRQAINLFLTIRPDFISTGVFMSTCILKKL